MRPLLRPAPRSGGWIGSEAVGERQERRRSTVDGRRREPRAVPSCERLAVVAGGIEGIVDASIRGWGGVKEPSWGVDRSRSPRAVLALAVAMSGRGRCGGWWGGVATKGSCAGRRRRDGGRDMPSERGNREVNVPIPSPAHPVAPTRPACPRRPVEASGVDIDAGPGVRGVGWSGYEE